MGFAIKTIFDLIFENDEDEILECKNNKDKLEICPYCGKRLDQSEEAK